MGAWPYCAYGHKCNDDIFPRSSGTDERGIRNHGSLAEIRKSCVDDVAASAWYSFSMSEFMKMDVFFFVTTLAVIVLTALISIAIWKLLKILKHVERIAEMAGEEAEHIRDDAAYVRGRVLGIIDALLAFIPRRRARREEPGESVDTS